MNKNNKRPESYKWLKEYLHKHEFGMPFVNQTVYYCIKHNLSEKETLSYVSEQAKKGSKVLMEHGTEGTLNFQITSEIHNMLPFIKDSLFELSTGKYFSPDPNDPNQWFPRYVLKEPIRTYAKNRGDIKLKYGSGSFTKKYLIDSDNHPINVLIKWHVNKQFAGLTAQTGQFINCCMEMWSLIKKLDDEPVELENEYTLGKKLGEWVRPLTPKEKNEKIRKDRYKNLNKSARKMLDKIKRLGLSEIFKELL